VQLTPLSTHWAPRKKNKKKGTISFGHGVYRYEIIIYTCKYETIN